MSAPLIASADRASWHIDTSLTTAFDFDYQGGREQLLRLYDRGTRKQWMGADRLDWSLEVDPTDPLGMPDQSIPDRRHPAVGPDERAGSQRGAPPQRGLALLAVHAR